VIDGGILVNKPNFYKVYANKPNRIKKLKLELAYKSLMDYLHATKSALPLLEDLWYSDLRRIQAFLQTIGFEEYAAEIAEIKKVCFTVHPSIGFAYYLRQDALVLNIWHWDFGSSYSGFLYENLRYRPIFEKASTLLHELQHRRQVKQYGVIGKSASVKIKLEIDALQVERRVLETYKKTKNENSLYRVHCCKIQRWLPTGDCIADFETTRELCHPILDALQESIDGNIAVLSKLSSEQELDEVYDVHDSEQLRITTELEQKLKLPIKKTYATERFIEIPFLAKKE
jgi:hypothetical protein